MEQFKYFWSNDPRPTWDPEGLTVETRTVMSRGVLSAERAQRVMVTVPMRVKALILPVVCKGRAGAPAPRAGLDLRSYPYDRGHVIGLQLGGADVSSNIVPQWRMLQQSGTWRMLETEILRLALAEMGKKECLDPEKWAAEPVPTTALFMVVDIRYGRIPQVPNSFVVGVYRVQHTGTEFTMGDRVLSRTLENAPYGTDTLGSEPTGDWALVGRAEAKRKAKDDADRPTKRAKGK